MFKAAIFDMDGTILDTIEDLTNALNYALKQTHHFCEYNRQEVSLFFGSGVLVAITRALCYELGMRNSDLLSIGTPHEILPEALDSEEVERIQKIFRDYYVHHCQIKTGPYKGMLDTLSYLKSQGILLAVVSNKQDNAVQALVEDYFKGFFDFALGERSSMKRKPYPDMVEECLKQLNVSKEEAIYIGDSEIDIQTAKNAQMPCVCVTWGFREVDYLKQQGASIFAYNNEQLTNIILK